MDSLHHLLDLVTFSILSDIPPLLPEYLHKQLLLALVMVLFLLVAGIIVYKKWNIKPEEQKNRDINATVQKSAPGIPKPTKKQDIIGSKNSDVKNEENKWKKPVGINMDNASSIPTCSDIKPKMYVKNVSTTQKTDSKIKTYEGSKLLAFSALHSEKDKSLICEIKIPEVKVSWPTKSEAKVHERQLIFRPERDEKKEEEDFENELKETEKQAEEDAKCFMRPINLNIDKNARSKVESKKIKEHELHLVRKMCGEFRDAAKLDGNEEKEEERKEMEKVRSARSYFKTVDKYRSESMSAVPRMKIRNEEDNYSKGNQIRLSQFEPGKISSKFTNIFGRDDATDFKEKRLSPKKKLITMEQVIKKGVGEEEETLTERDIEMQELREARKNWVPTEDRKDEKKKFDSLSKPDSVRNRWNPVNSERQEKTRSLEVPHKLNIQEVFVNDSKADSKDPKLEIEKELNEIREARPTPLAKRWKPKQYQKPAERSKSAHVLQRAKLADNSWVVEKSDSRMEEERRKAKQELELIKKLRMESLEVFENAEMERPASRQELQQFDTQKEIEIVRKRFESDENIMEKQNTEKMEKTNPIQDDNMHKNPDFKCVRFDETKKEKEISVEKETEDKTINLESKVKIKLKQIKQKTEEEVSKLKNKKSKQYQNIENEIERTRQEEAIRKAAELRQLALDLQHRREAREAEDRPGPVNEQYQEEVNQRLRELAELARCGTLATHDECK